jgi:shikimate kinase
MVEHAGLVAATAPRLDRPVVLVGMMGAGKSSIGGRVARRLGVPFVDVDAEIVEREGRSVATIFADDGEAAFRAIEHDVLAELLARTEPCVVATGGGSVLAPANRALLTERATVIWLRASPGVLAHRVPDDGTRPLLGDDPRAALTRIAAEREPLYREVAAHIVDVDRVDRRVVRDQVLAWLGVDPAELAHLPDDDDEEVDP